MASNRRQEERRKHAVVLSAWDKEKLELVPPTNVPMFGPHHFPVGTRVRLSKEAPVGGGDEHVVMRMHTIGARNFVLQSTTLHCRYSNVGAFDPFHRLTFNISWVEAIIERGTGQLPESYPNSLDESLSSDDIIEARNHARDLGLRVGKNDYCWFAHNRYHILDLAAQFTGHDALIDMQKLLGAMEQQGWLYQPIKFYSAFYIVPKKRFKAWLRRNINRFLVKLDAWQDMERADQEEEYRRYCDDMDDALDAYDDNDDYDAVEHKKAYEDMNRMDDIGSQNDRRVVELNGVAFDELEELAHDETFSFKG